MDSSKKAPWLFFFLLIFSFGGFLIRLIFLQIVSGARLAQKAEQNRLKILPTIASRGVIYDRNGIILARNTTSGREYPLGSALAHLIGFVGEANEEELNVFALSPGSLVGKMGIEREEDKVLRGFNGGTLVETDASGHTLRQLSQKEAIVGQDLHLFIDVDLQKRAGQILAGQKGAIIASTADSKILLLASSPAFDPNLFSKNIYSKVKDGDKEKELEKVLNSPDRKIFNRAIAGLYPPASTFKIVTTTAGLETGVIDKTETIEDTGEIRVGKFRYGNWYFDQYGKKEGQVDIIKALKRSNDIYFYKVGERLGVTRLSNWAKAFGLGKITNIPLAGEEAGLVPDENWKKTVKHEQWYLGDTYIMAIGQGDLQTTPIQVHQMMALIANNGASCAPKIVNDGVKQDCRQLPISQEVIKVVQEGLKEACADGGTGWPFFNFKIKTDKIKIDGVNYFRKDTDAVDEVRIPVACKTGTAEFGHPEDKTHAWFTVFAPVENPEIVVTVLLEEAGQGSDKAGPLAKQILQTWFESKD